MDRKIRIEHVNTGPDYCGRLFIEEREPLAPIARLVMTNNQGPSFVDEIAAMFSHTPLDHTVSADGVSKRPQSRELSVLERDRVCALLSEIISAAINRSPMTEIRLEPETVKLFIGVKDALETLPEDQRR